MSKTLFKPLNLSRKHGKILNIDLSSTSEQKVLSFVRDSIAHNSRFFIVTPNAEIVLASISDSKLAWSLNAADIALPDGVPILSAVKLGELNLPKTRIFRFIKLLFYWILYFYIYTFDRQRLEGETRLIKGREMFLELAKLANKKHWRIFLLGGKADEAEAAAEVLGRSLKSAKIAYAAGPILNQNAEPVSQRDILVEKNTLDSINKFAPQILFVGFGAPKQEKWTYKWLSKLNIGGAMVVGGTFNYISGRASLPPKWMEKAGLEWLWRLICEPARIGRILKAVVLFPLKVFWYKVNLNA